MAHGHWLIGLKDSMRGQLLRLRGLRVRVLALILAVYAVAGILLFVGFELIFTRLTERLGTVVTRMQVVTNKSLIREPLTREIALARQLAASPLLQSWAQDENNPRLRTQALAELESFRLRFSGGTWFYAIDATLHYYFNDAQNRYAGRELAYTLDPARPSDAWYFATRRHVADYALNVSPSEQLGLVKVWTNVVVRDPDGRILGVAGSGIDLSEFLRRFIDRGDLGIDNILVDSDLHVQAHPDPKLIDFNTIAGAKDSRARLDRLFGPQAYDRIRAHLSGLSGGRSEVEVVPLTIEGKPCLVGIAYLPELKWYTMAVVDLSRVIDRRVFLPLLAVAVLAVLAATLLLGWRIDHVVLRRLAPLARSARLLEHGDYSLRLAADRDDEIGDLTSAFSVMATAVRAHTDTLEEEVRKRTETLASQKEALDRKNRELEQTLAHVRRLEGLLPVCSHCKRIRIDPAAPGIPDRWVPLEEYLKSQTTVQFSHGICADCLQLLYPDFADTVLDKKRAPGDDPDGGTRSPEGGGRSG
jgi:HAMP domain-containing protein